MSEGYVSFVGCSYGRRLLKVSQPDKRQRIRARCPVPGCPEGEHSTTAAMPRPRRPGERCDTEVIDALPAASNDPTRLRGVQTVTDAAIEAAFPAERWTRVVDAEAGLGYSPGTALVRRLGRMNERQRERSQPAAFALRRFGPSWWARRAVGPDPAPPAAATAAFRRLYDDDIIAALDIEPQRATDVAQAIGCKSETVKVRGGQLPSVKVWRDGCGRGLPWLIALDPDPDKVKLSNG